MQDPALLLLRGCVSVLLLLPAALEDDGLVNINHVQAAIRMQAGSTREPDHVVVVDAFKGVCQGCWEGLLALQLSLQERGGILWV